MNDAEKKVIRQKQIKEFNINFDKKFELIKSKILYHHNIDNYLKEVPIIFIGDVKHYSKFDSDNISLMKNLLRSNYYLLSKQYKIDENIYYIVRRDRYQTISIAFIGTEKSTMEKAVIQKASSNNNIPHIVNNTIRGKIDKQIIMDVMLNYDRAYGILLLKIYNSILQKQ